jgi:threonine aldolase
MITAEQVQLMILSFISPLTSLVCVENTTNKGGGVLLCRRFAKIKQVCINNLKFHLMVPEFECFS